MERFTYFLVMGLVFVGGLGFTIFSERYAVGGISTLLVTAAMLIYFVLARRGVPTPASPEKRIRRALGGGRPVVVHLFSDYHLGSLLRRPLVAGVERDFRSRCNFIYINMSHREAEAVAEWLEADIGDFVVYDAQGKLVERTARITRNLLAGLLERPVH